MGLAFVIYLWIHVCIMHTVHTKYWTWSSLEYVSCTVQIRIFCIHTTCGRVSYVPYSALAVCTVLLCTIQYMTIYTVHWSRSGRLVGGPIRLQLVMSGMMILSTKHETSCKTCSHSKLEAHQLPRRKPLEQHTQVKGRLLISHCIESPRFSRPTYQVG